MVSVGSVTRNEMGMCGDGRDGPPTVETDGGIDRDEVDEFVDGGR